jgi:hypothetical protein
MNTGKRKRDSSGSEDLYDSITGSPSPAASDAEAAFNTSFPRLQAEVDHEFGTKARRSGKPDPRVGLAALLRLAAEKIT